MDHDHSEDPEYVSEHQFTSTVERLERALGRAMAQIDALRRDLGYKAEERHDHRGYAEERHYH